jgi:hypothetical protein
MVVSVPDHLADARTRSYVLCLAIPFVLLPLAVACWSTWAVGRNGRIGPARVAAFALLAGLIATAAFWMSVELALAFADRLPSLISRFTLRNAWVFVLIWSVLYAAISGVAHSAALACLRRPSRPANSDCRRT